MSFFRLAPIACALAALLVGGSASAALVSEDSPFGTDTITLDTDTGLRWLDMTLSNGLSHDEVLQALQSGGTFEGFRLATSAELGQLFANAGFDLNEDGNFVPQNFTPAVTIGGLVGVLGDNGNCGDDPPCTFFFTAGFLADPPFIPNTFAEGNFAFFDNTAGQDPNSPSAPVGRAILQGGSFGDGFSGQGAWLVVIPEPGTLALLLGGLAGLAAAGRPRR
jgi:PEP-CTERM motif